ncbi:F-box/FBD/LRR-repeat protein At1g13570-like [Carex rostrata]
MASVTDQNQSAKKPTLATDQEEEQQDIISSLPDEILHTILSMLNISDAAVTTAVSKRWSTLFPTLPFVEINFFPSFNRRDPELKWVDALISFLQSRKTVVKKFAICKKLDAGDFDLVLQLVCVAADKGVPSQLTGFRSVKSLLLVQVEVADDDFQRMISWCNAMKNLSILDCLKVKNIVICAPSLSELVICLVWPARVVLKSVPRLVSVAIAFNYGSDEREGRPNEASNLMALLNGLAHVKDLRLDFSNNYRMVDKCMYSNRPNALELNFWKKQLLVECVKHHLTTATFYLDDYC